MTDTAESQWHYERYGKYLGPVDRAEMIDLIQKSVVRPDTLVCFGKGDWIPARNSELSFAFPRHEKAGWIPVVFSPFGLILSLNVVVFLLMVISGVSPFQPTTQSLLAWGANFGPKTTSGEWWRLLACTFLHIGLLHIAFNMFVFVQIGPLMQRLLGKVGFTIVYLVSGLAGSLASLGWNPYVVGAGASGAIFGLYGALLGFAAVQRGKVSSRALSSLVLSAVVFIGYNVVYGLTHPGTDIAAHFGGLVGGFICSLTLCVGMGTETGARALRNVAVSVVAALLMIVVAIELPRPVDIEAKVKQFGEVEARTVAKFNAASKDFRIRKLKADDFANLVEHEVLPDWISEIDLMKKLKGLPQRQGQLVSLIVQYMELRRDAWSDLAAGVRENQPDKLQDAAKKQREADRVAGEIGKLGKSR